LLRQSGTEGDKSRIVSLSSLAHAFVFSNIDYDGLQVSLAEIVLIQFGLIFFNVLQVRTKGRILSEFGCV